MRRGERLKFDSRLVQGWRRGQHRRRRLTRRGRWTLAGGAFLAASLAAVLLDDGAVESPDPHATTLPPVAGRPPPPAALPAGLVDTVLRQLPVGEQALAQPVMRAAPDPSGAGEDAGAPRHLVSTIQVEAGLGRSPYPVRVDYSLDRELSHRVFKILSRGRVALGHVIVLDPASSRVLAYASTDPERFPPTRAYPAASLIKVVTAAAALDADPEVASRPCHFVGNPYRLTRSRLDPPKRGRETTLRRALAMSNNQCFAQLAVHTVGSGGMLAAIDRFGLREVPAPVHAAGQVDPGEDALDLGRLGSGLDGTRITPLHAARLAATLADGVLREPTWVERITGPDGRVVPLPAPRAPRQVLTPDLAARLREMLVDTTRRGTARRAFRDRRGRPLLGEVRVAGKTGSLSGRDPDGRYEWFIGLAPAEAPTIAVATLLVQGDLWWRNASQIAAEVLEEILCTDGPRSCDAARAARWRGGVGGSAS